MNIDFIIQNFEHIFDSEGKIKNFDSIILQLAVSGKLKTQNPEDEPASELLKKNKAEKEKLIKEGKIKREKDLSPVLETEIPYELPKCWEWVRLGNIIQLISGQDMTTFEYNDEKRGIPYITGASNIDESTLIINRWTETPKSISNKQDLLVTCKGTVGKTIINTVGNVHIARQVMAIRSYSYTNVYYLKYFIDSFVKQLILKAKSMIPGISRIDITNIVFPLPPLEEQKRIVQTIENLFSKSKQIKEHLSKKAKKLSKINNSAFYHLQQSKTDEEFKNNFSFILDNFNDLCGNQENLKGLRQSILQLTVQGKLVPQNPEDEPASELLKKIKAEKEKLIKEGKIKKEKDLPPITKSEIPYNLPEDWEWVRLRDLGITQTGTTPPTNNPEYFGNDYPFIKPADISEQGINYNNEGLTELGVQKGRLIKANSVLMVCIGGSIGKVGIIDRDCSCNQQINAITLFESIFHHFIFSALKSPYFYKEVIKTAPQTTLPIISKGKWEQLIIPLPPLEEQKRIVQKIYELMRMCNELEQGIKIKESKSDELLQSVVGHVCKGEA